MSKANSPMAINQDDRKSHFHATHDEATFSQTSTSTNSPMAINHDDRKSHFHATHDEATFSQTSTSTTSPFNSFIVEYDNGGINIYPHSSEEPNIRLKQLTLSGELGQPKTVFSKYNNHSVMQPPPAQPMGEYEPNRIPGSAFCNKNAAPDWSVQSNESLFSIHMGNSSFNTEHPTFLQKSEELPKIDDMRNHSSGLPPLYDAARENKNITDNPKKEASTGAVECLTAEMSSAPCNSNNGSNSGMPAFSFPLLNNADMRNSLGKLSPATVHMQRSYSETPKAAPDNEVVVNSSVAAATTTTTVKITSWLSFSCCR